jgi:hypothetical protein
MIVYCFHCSRTSFLAPLTVFLLNMLYKQMQALMLEEYSFASNQYYPSEVSVEAADVPLLM